MKLKIKWMDEFDRETGFKYHKAVKQELAHYLISRYKRTLQPQVWQMARKQMKEINFAQKCNYYCQYILFRLGGDKFREFWFNTKRAIRKDQV